MAQAKRIKRKPTKKQQAERPLPDLPWGLIFVIVVCGVVIGLLFNGANKDRNGFGAGLQAFLSNTESQIQPDSQIDVVLKKQVKEKDFAFYEVLPDIEQVMPDDLPEAAPVRTPDNVEYYMQAASFRQFADAEKLRARLALKGIKSVTQTRKVVDKGTYYRVRLGPYADKRKAKNARTPLQKLGLKPLIYRVTKG